MRTHRLTLLVTEAEKARITRQAAALGTSASEYVRKAAILLDADDIAALEDVRSLLPEFNAALARIHANLTAASDHSEKQHREIARMRTPEYRQEVYRSIAKDEAGLEAVAALFGVAPPDQGHPRTEPPKSATLFERMSNIARARSQVNERRAPWREDDSQRKQEPSE